MKITSISFEVSIIASQRAIHEKKRCNFNGISFGASSAWARLLAFIAASVYRVGKSRLMT
jgi:hypothetical protein